MSSILVIDDHPIVLQGCRRILEDAGHGPIFAASTAADGFRAYRRDRPGFIVLDLALRAARLGGLSFVRRLRVHDAHVPVLVFSMHRDPVIVSRALELGANGYLLKDTPSGELAVAVGAISAGKRYLSLELASEVVLLNAREQQNPLRGMTLRELETLSHLAEGKSLGAIAKELHLSYKTISNTAAQIKAKLGVTSITELTRAAIRHLPSAVRAWERDPS